MKDRLWKIYENWEIELDKNEWYFSDCYDELTENLSSSDAYDAIPAVLDVLLHVKDTYLVNETLDFLLIIYNIADTTEVHPILLAEWHEINRKLEQMGDSFSVSAWDELRQMLRIT
ncbi:ABC transporter [Terribacillus sp. DMT04]|uniref:ABC transporter n=1 Tax=Terribacillus sp. DMT04 TaxID=2850441 RepID=UPI001C2C205C|nr:ABC transporter [Terribacillus sp. DMT04]QXE02429.1 ABC transporter [Terribacillus sp. DMT04]